MIEFIVNAWPFIVAACGVIAGLLAFWHRALESKKLSIEIKNLRTELREKTRSIDIATKKEIDEFGGGKEFREVLQSQLQQSRAAFQGRYKDELNSLLGLSKEEIDRITPDTTDLETYQALIDTIKEASSANISQAELKNRIEELGSVAVSIAKRIPSLGALID